MRTTWLFMLAIIGLTQVVPGGAIAAPARAEDKMSINKARIDAALKQMVTDGRAAGTSALIWKDGREVYFGTSGDADREAKRPMRRDTIIQIFSMTKPVTGVALMQLWEQGKFGLDDPIATYLPEFANMQTYAGTDANGIVRYRPAARQITIRDVMRHTAGFANSGADTPAHVAYTKADPSRLDHDLTEMGRRLATVPLLYDPGERWYYGIAPDVQALLIEKISGQPYAAYVKQHIFDPLGMKDTAWRQPDANFARFSAMYNLQDGKLVRVADDINRTLNFQDNKLTPGAYGLASTLDDYMRFALMLLGNGALDGVRLLKPSTIKLMASDHLDPRMTDRSWLPSKGAVGFGFNFAVRHSQPQTAEENRGAVGEYFWDGAAANMFWVDPANNMAAVYFVQTQPFTATLQRDFREAVYGKGYLGPKGD
jgi:CubicO group peptidase (beta-lactamase class C family)